ncbi:MAG: SAVED domain-containing protein [Planctomycetia bacterium]|nr:SAVED domain-containing protein [Planctomycetia bacterium]
MAEMNRSYIAHITAQKEDGPRGDPILSPKLVKDFNNLMLLCDTHHRLIDIDDVKNHPVDILKTMKDVHENRIEQNCSIHPNMDTYIIIYKSNIGKNSPHISYESVCQYILPEHYPASPRAIELGLTNSTFNDKNNAFWTTEIINLETQFNEQLRQRIRNREINHISIFAMAPIPLLIKLGYYLNDIQNVEIHQPIREPKTWKWIDKCEDTKFIVNYPKYQYDTVALNISLSGTINNDRIVKTLGEKCSIYTITIENPFNDFLKCKKQLEQFSVSIKKLFNKIKSEYNSATPLHVFPAMPASTSIELGRVWMPKADMPLIIYDENTANNGFTKILTIKNE